MYVGKTGERMYRVRATAHCIVEYLVRANSEEEARAKWEAADPSLGKVNDDSIDSEDYKETSLLGTYDGSTAQKVDMAMAGAKQLKLTTE